MKKISKPSLPSPALCSLFSALPQYARVFTPDVITDLLRAAPLHDVGKVGINDNVLTKNSVLDNQEFAYMQQHTILGGLAFEKALEEHKTLLR